MSDTTPALSSKYLLFVGTYTDKESKGIYAYRFDPVSSELLPLGLVAETTNPSFLITDRNARFLYAVNEISNFSGTRNGSVMSLFSLTAA